MRSTRADAGRGVAHLCVGARHLANPAATSNPADCGPTSLHVKCYFRGRSFKRERSALPPRWVFAYLTSSASALPHAALGFSLHLLEHISFAVAGSCTSTRIALVRVSQTLILIKHFSSLRLHDATKEHIT
jgi:hypothetical protein